MLQGRRIPWGFATKRFMKFQFAYIIRFTLGNIMKPRNTPFGVNSLSRGMLLLTLVCFGGTLAEAKTLKVPSKFATIQEAIDAASAGDSIKISSGTFTENIVIDKKLKIRGKSKTRIVAADDGAPVVTIAANNVELKRLDIRGGTFGVLTSGFVSRPKLLSLRVHEASSHGISLLNADNGLLSKCRIYDNGGNGISASNSSMKKCRVYKNGFHGISPGSQSTIDSCRVYENGAAGVTLHEDTDAVIKKSRFWKNANGILVGDRSTGIVIENNVFSNNLGDGLRIFESVGVARNNRSEKNRVGFFAVEASWVFEGNEARRNASVGFDLQGMWSSDISRNEARGNLGVGFRFLPGPAGQFADNVAKENADHGFLVKPFVDQGPFDNPASVVGNRSTFNGGDGFHAEEESLEEFVLSFTDNYSDGNVGYGFVEDGDNIYEGNTCGGNNGAGPSDPVGLCE